MRYMAMFAHKHVQHAAIVRQHHDQVTCFKW